MHHVAILARHPGIGALGAEYRGTTKPGPSREATGDGGLLVIVAVAGRPAPSDDPWVLSCD